MNYAQLIERERELEDDQHWAEVSRLCRDRETRRQGRKMAMERIKAIGYLRKYQIDGERYLFEPGVMGSQCEMMTDETRDVRHVIYIIVDDLGVVAYVGQTTQPLSKRLHNHDHRSLIGTVYFIQAGSRLGELNRLESALIRVLQPYANKLMADLAIIEPSRVLDKYGIDYRSSNHLSRRLGLECGA